MPDTPVPAGTEIKIFRSELLSQPGSQRRTRSWLYGYVSPVEQRGSRGDDTEWVIAAGQEVEWGTGLVDFRDWLKRKFGRQIKITEEWKQAAH